MSVRRQEHAWWNCNTPQHWMVPSAAGEPCPPCRPLAERLAGMPQLAELSLPGVMLLQPVQQAAAAPPNLRRLHWAGHEAAWRKVYHVAPHLQLMGPRLY